MIDIGAHDWPQKAPPSPSPIISTLPFVLALLLAAMGNFPTRNSTPSSLSCSSLLPTQATSWWREGGGGRGRGRGREGGGGRPGERKGEREGGEGGGETGCIV